jgi:hypothetical protein
MENIDGIVLSQQIHNHATFDAEKYLFWPETQSHALRQAFFLSGSIYFAFKLGMNFGLETKDG